MSCRIGCSSCENGLVSQSPPLSLKQLLTVLLTHLQKFQSTESFLPGSSIAEISFPSTSGKYLQSVLVFDNDSNSFSLWWKQEAAAVSGIKGTRRRKPVFSQEKKSCSSSFSQQQNKQQYNLVLTFHHWEALGCNCCTGKTLHITFLVSACIFFTLSKGFLWAFPLVDASNK